MINRLEMLSTLSRFLGLFGRDGRRGAGRNATGASEPPTGPALTLDKEHSVESSKDWLTITSNDEQQEGLEVDLQQHQQQQQQQPGAGQPPASNQDGRQQSAGSSGGSNLTSKLVRHSKGLINGALSSIVRSSASNEYVITDDISGGREQLKLPAISYVRNDKAPQEYHYVTEYVQCAPIDVDVSLAKMSSKCACSSSSDCSGPSCGCSLFSYKDKQGQQKWGRFYDASGRLSSDYQLEAPVVIHECNVACGCNRRLCRNMVIQGGCRVRLVLFRTKSRGWGIRTLEDLKRGTFVGVYSGELISVSQSYDRQDDTYLFNLCNTHIIRQRKVKPTAAATNEEEADATETIDETQLANDANTNKSDNNQFVCDAKFYGNFTRFINHSCEPNVIGIRTFTVHHDERFPYISFFTNQDVKANSELTLNYGDNYWLVKCKRDKVYCRCKRRACRFTRRTFPATLKSYEDHQKRQQQQQQQQQEKQQDLSDLAEQQQEQQ